MPNSPATQRRLPRAGLAALALALLTAALYGRVLGAGFLTFDDTHYVTGNPEVARGLSWEGFRWAWTTTQQSNWHPLTWLSHMLDAQLFGLDPAGHHATSALLHAANAALVLLALAALTGSLWRSSLAAALFALHPLRVESVAWVAERKDVLSLLFGLLALLAYARYARRPRPVALALVALCLALSLLAKPMLVTLPCVLLLLDYWPLGRLRLGGGRIAESGRLLVEKLLLFALAAASATLTFLAQWRHGTVESLAVLGLGARLANVPVSYARYLGKTLWPAGLAVFYPQPAGGWPATAVAATTALVLLLTGLALVQLRRRPFLAVGWLWFLGALVPVIGLVQTGAQSLADRYTYFPSIGLLLALVWLVPEDWVATRWRAAAMTAAAALVLALLAAQTWRQLGYWRDSATLFAHALEVTPDNYLARTNLGLARLTQGRYEEAEDAFAASLELLPGSAEALTNLGVALYQQGRVEEAIGAYRRALARRPRYAEAWSNLGLAYARLGADDAAGRCYRRALTFAPDHAAAHYNTAQWLLRRGRSDAAVGELRRALAANPQLCAAHRTLGALLRQRGAAAEAEAHLARARACIDWSPSQVLMERPGR